MKFLVEDVIFGLRAMYDEDNISAALFSLMDDFTQRLVKIHTLEFCGSDERTFWGGQNSSFFVWEFRSCRNEIMLTFTNSEIVGEDVVNIQEPNYSLL